MRKLSALLLTTLIPFSPLWADFTKEDIETRYNTWLRQEYTRFHSPSYGGGAAGYGYPYASSYGSSAGAAMGGASSGAAMGGASSGAYTAALEAFKRQKAAEMHPAYRVVKLLWEDITPPLENEPSWPPHHRGARAKDATYVADAYKAITAILTRGEYFGGFNTSRQANTFEAAAAYNAIRTLGAVDRSNILGVALKTAEKTVSPAVAGHLSLISDLFNLTTRIRGVLDEQLSPHAYVEKLNEAWDKDIDEDPITKGLETKGLTFESFEKELQVQKGYINTPRTKEQAENNLVIRKNFLDRILGKDFLISEFAPFLTPLVGDKNSIEKALRVERAWQHKLINQPTDYHDYLEFGALYHDLQYIYQQLQRPKEKIHEKLRELLKTFPALELTPQKPFSLHSAADGGMEPSGASMDFNVLVDLLTGAEGITSETLQEYINGVPEDAQFAAVRELLEEEYVRLWREEAPIRAEKAHQETLKAVTAAVAAMPTGPVAYPPYPSASAVAGGFTGTTAAAPHYPATAAGGFAGPVSAYPYPAGPVAYPPYPPASAAAAGGVTGIADDWLTEGLDGFAAAPQVQRRMQHHPTGTGAS